MPKHADFQKIYNRFIKQYGEKKGKSLYYAWINKKGYDDTKPFPKKKEKKELMCSVVGMEIKEMKDTKPFLSVVNFSEQLDLKMLSLELSGSISLNIWDVTYVTPRILKNLPNVRSVSGSRNPN